MSQANQKFEETWYPRIGKEAAEELRRDRKFAVLTAPINLLCVCGVGVLLGLSLGPLGDVGAGVFAVGWIVWFASFRRAQIRLGKAVCDWYGMKRIGMPRMTP